MKGFIMKRIAVFVLCLMIVMPALAQEEVEKPNDKPKEKTVKLESGLKAGQKFTCKVAAMMGYGDNNEKLMKSDYDFKFGVEKVAEDGTARFSGTAEGKEAMGGEGQMQERSVNKQPFAADITKRWGCKFVEGQKDLFPGFEPAKDFLPEKPLKVGDKWEADLTKVMAGFLLRFSATIAAPDADLSDDMKEMMLKQRLDMLGRMKADAELTFAEMKGDIAVIKGEIKKLSFGREESPAIDRKKSHLRLEFDTKNGCLKLFESKLRMTMPGGGYSMTLTFKQELKLIEPRKVPQFAEGELAKLVEKSDLIAAVQVVVFEKRGEYNYYVVENISEAKGESGRKHLDLIAEEGMEFDKGEKMILFLKATEEFGRTMFRLADPGKAVAPYDAEFFKKVTETAKTGK